MDYNKNIVKQAIVIGGSKFVSLSMPFADIVILSKLSSNNNALSDYIFSTQIIQVFVVICLSLSVGIPIYYNQNQDKKNTISTCMGYSLFLGISIFSFSLLLLYFLNYSEQLTTTQYLTYIYLSIGFLFLPAYIVFSYLLDTLGKSNKVFNLTIVFAILNFLLNTSLVLASDLYDQVAVSLTTTIIRFLGAFIFIILIFKEFNISYIKPSIHIKNFIKIGSFGLSDAMTGLLFSTSFALLTYYLNANYSNEVISTYGILLNFINIIFVIYIGLSSSLAINLSKNKEHHKNNTIPNPQDPYWNRFIIIFCLSIGFIIFLLLPVFSWLYFTNINTSIIVLMTVALLVALFDGMNISIISKLRVLGFKKYPPLFRMSLVFFGMPLGVILLPHLGINGIFIAFAIANFTTLMALVFFDQKIPKLSL